MRGKKHIFLLLFLFLFSFVFSQEKNPFPDKEKKIGQKGWFISPLPILTFDSDIGINIGAFANFYDYGKGLIYPGYMHFFQIQASYSSKKSGIFRLFYDSDKLLKINGKYYRFTADLGYLLDGAMPFYGFNGYESNYEKDFTDVANDRYISKIYYRMNRKLLKMQADIQGDIIGKKFRWIAGMTAMNYKIKNARRNELSSKEKHLPDTTTLFEEYKNYGLINSSEAGGGNIVFFKTGLVVDTRDIKANASKGFWDEALVYFNPAFFMDKIYSFVAFSAIHRHYITLIKNKLTFVYRIGGKVLAAGKEPFYFTPYIVSSFNINADHDGLGGNTTLRGINRLRIIADGFVYANFCLRFKIWNFSFFNIPAYLALNTFMDAGQTIQPFETDAGIRKQMESDLPGRYFYKESDTPHFSLGGGIHFALNENFVLKINASKSLNPQDGYGGIYFTTDWIF